MLQKYIATPTTKLYTLENIGQLNKDEAKKYYKIKDVFVDRNIIGDYGIIKENKGSSIEIYLVSPMFDWEKDNLPVKVMLCGGYQKEISHRLSAESKNNEYEQFGKHAASQFKDIEPDKITYFAQITETSPNYRYFFNAANKLDTNANWIFLSPQLKPFKAESGNSYLLLTVVF